jgi:hypothetical protein
MAMTFMASLLFRQRFFIGLGRRTTSLQEEGNYK